VAVVEGDQQTDNDARRIAATGVPVVQINTGAACHLDAHQVGHALADLDPPAGALVLVENVGNLICPAGFDLGQRADVTVLSVTEGDDKPEKYPEAFHRADALVLSKVDLLPHLDFDPDRAEGLARALNPHLPCFRLSAKTGDGLAPWIDWLVALH
jgi:hydrogenase nickel incorporation protein HypB